jgi:response regulator RpfG family c-di-GMP phosphodiesterase
MSDLRILLVNDNTPVRDILSLGISLKYQCEVVEVKDDMAAIEILNKDPEFSLVICDFNMSKANGAELFSFMQDKGLTIPYVICSTDSPEQHSFFENGPLFGSITVPSIVEGLDKVFDKLAGLTDNCIELKQKFVPVSLNILSTLKETPVNLYLKLSEDKVLKVMRSGDQFGAVDYQKFSDKGLGGLLIEQCDGTIFLAKLEKELFNVFANESITDEDKIIYVHEVISSVASSFGFSERVLDLTADGIEFCMGLIAKDDNVKTLVDKLLLQKDSYLSTNAIICAHVCAAIVDKMDSLKDKKEEVMRKLALASFLQDITLPSAMIKTYQDFKHYVEQNSELSKKEIKIFKQHPLKAAELISTSETNLPDLETIIQEQHEHPMGTGFPKGLGPSNISALGAIFIFANSVSEVIYRNFEMKDELSNELILQSIDFVGETENSSFLKAIDAFKISQLFN